MTREDARFDLMAQIRACLASEFTMVTAVEIAEIIEPAFDEFVISGRVSGSPTPTED